MISPKNKRDLYRKLKTVHVKYIVDIWLSVSKENVIISVHLIYASLQSFYIILHQGQSIRHQDKLTCMHG